MLFSAHFSLRKEISASPLTNTTVPEVLSNKQVSPCKFLKLIIKNPELLYHTELMLRVSYLLVQHGIDRMDASSTDSEVDDDNCHDLHCEEQLDSSDYGEESDPESDIEDEPTYETETDGPTTSDMDVDTDTEQPRTFKR